MSELLPVLNELVREAEAGREVALCVVVKTRGSTPQSAGAAMLVRGDYSTLGTLGGGCVEAEVRRRAFELLQRRRSAELEFVLDHDYGWDDGLICGGKMTVAVSSIAPGSDLAAFRAAIQDHGRRQAVRLPINIQHEDELLEYRLCVEPPPTLLIAGAGHVGQAVARLAVELDWDVVVLDDRPDLLTAERFGQQVRPLAGDIAESLRAYAIDEHCYVVIVTRGHARDHQALDAVIRSPARYIGLIGSRRKSKLILGDLAAAGVPDELIQRVHTPIGLPIGAVTVKEIAVSIVAELVQVRRSGDCPPLVLGPIRRTAGDSAPSADTVPSSECR